MRILLVTPPLTQLNAPYPATAHLAGFLRAQGREAEQADAGLELVLRLFSRDGLARVAGRLAALPARRRPPSARRFLAEAARYAATVEPVVGFLQGRDPTLAYRLVTRRYLPEGPRFAPLDADAAGGDPATWAFGALGTQDYARHLASLYLDDLTDVVRESVDARFDLARYGERLAAGAASFTPLQRALRGPPTLVDELLDELAEALAARHKPELVGLTIPFPGNVYGALRLAAGFKRARPDVRIVLGGGYASTELRALKDARVFEHVDFIVLDDGELPLLRIIEHVEGGGAPARLLRTYRRAGRRVVWTPGPETPDPAPAELGTPAFEGLPLDRYLSLLEMLNPMHRLWSDGCWQKLALAHGCYWRRCAFCDTRLPYIRRYRPTPADLVVERLEQVVARTGRTGFHFVDEALPPALLRRLAEQLLARGITATWWGNVRFEPEFTPALARLMARAGCIAVTGGLECAHDRLLTLMNKGITLSGAARACRALSDAGLLVHAYLMFGFPTQTVRETVEGLEFVRQMFAAGCLHSAFWHRFALTVHSPIAREPEAFGLRLAPAPGGGFACNELAYSEPGGANHARLGDGLRRAVHAYMHGVGIENPVTGWFASRVPRPGLAPDAVEQMIAWI